MAMTIRHTEEFRRGRAGEHLVAGFLKARGWYVIPSYDYSGEDGDKPPRLEGRAEALPVPDLDVSRDGVRVWIEVKTKAAPTYTRKTGQLEHGIPLRHYHAYRRVQRITGCRVWLFIVEEGSGEVLYSALDDLEHVRRIYKGDKMSRGGMVFWPRSAFQKLAWTPMIWGAGDER